MIHHALFEPLRIGLHLLGPPQLSIDLTDGDSILRAAGVLEQHGEWDGAFRLYALAAELLRGRQDGVYAANCVKEVREKLNRMSTADDDLVLLKHRLVRLDSVVSDESAKWVIAKLLFLQDQDAHAPIHLWVDSDGGSVLAGLAIIETIKGLRPPVHTRCYGRAHSIAAAIVASGRKGDRQAFSDAQLSLTPLVLAGGKPADEGAFHRLLQDVAAIIAERTGQTQQAVRSDMDRGRRFDAAEAKEYGFIDAVMDAVFWRPRILDIQPIPTLSRADVERVVRRDYPPEQLARVIAILDGYGGKDWQPESDRVHLAALKLAAGDVEELARLLDGCDYRDLLAAAEYPGYTKRWDIYRLPTSEFQRTIDEDWAQYVGWLNRQ